MSLFGKQQHPAAPQPAREIRDTLFGDAPLGAWPSGEATGEPWLTFVAARTALAAGNTADALNGWQRIVESPGLESRHYLQAWQFLRAQGIGPNAARSKELLGVVLEVTVDGGLDLLAAYPERSARFYNFNGAGVVWEHANDSLDPAIDALLAAGQRVLDAIGPWDKPRPPAPPQGQVRINMLSPAGLHFGQSTFETFSTDALAGPVLQAGVTLMQQLIAKDPRSRKTPA